MSKATAIALTVAGTRMVFALEDAYEYVGGTGSYLRCKWCAAITDRPGQHLFWHMERGDVEPPEKGEGND